jgi:hypothetical protein
LSLWTQFYFNEGKKAFKWSHYLPIYEHHFQRFVNRPLTLLEIGGLNGGSLQMWKGYFGPQATIVCIDINPEVKQHEEDQIHVRIGDQSDTAFLQTLVDEFGQFDIVIDDGSHFSPHQIVSFDFLYPHTKENGVYLVEDTHTSYWPEWGGLKRPGTFMEFTKDLIDSLNAYHTRNALPVSEFTNSTTSMHFYDSVVVFEKGRMLRRHDITVGKDENGVRQRSERQSLPYQKTR